VVLGYLIDIVLGISDPERRPLRFALFAGFFPLITAGPIERSEGLLPQLGLDITFSSEQALAGLRQIFWGLVLKLLFADALVDKANLIFRWPGRYIPLEELLGIIFFAFYVYADFSGYSLIAIGSAKMLGLEVRPNFRQPYLSTSVPDFWRNWHISLASWVRDYVFAPLRTSLRRSRNWGLVGAVVLSFAILGIWHGAGWNYLIFGLMHGLFVTGSIYTVGWRDKAWLRVGAPKSLVHVERVLVTFTLVLLTLVIYNSRSLGDALTIYSDLFSRTFLRNIGDGLSYLILGRGDPLIMTAINLRDFGWWLIAMIVAGDILVRRGMTLDRCPRVVQFFAYNVGIALIGYHWMAAKAGQPFLYYKF
jgi:D-alanyl-lipoteichoic acid acyltransferase DltB (MBOAT superfamily)